MSRLSRELRDRRLRDQFAPESIPASVGDLDDVFRGLAASSNTPAEKRFVDDLATRSKRRVTLSSQVSTVVAGQLLNLGWARPVGRDGVVGRLVA